MVTVQQNPPLQAVITMNLSHNHAIRCAEALRNLRVSSSTKEKFHSYFADGLTPAQAMMHHENKLMVCKLFIKYYAI